MADWTINSGSNPSHFATRGGAATPLIRYFQESTCASTAVIKLGDIVSNDTVVSTGGFRIVRAPFNGGNGANLLNTTNVLGVATEASTSDGSTAGLNSTNPNVRRIGVMVAEAGASYLGYLIGDLNVSASSLIGLQRAVRYDSTNKIYGIDSTNSTAALASVVITNIPDGTVGDTNGPVIFQFLSTGVSAAVRTA